MSNEEPTRPMPVTVIEAIARVMEELPGIGKNDTSEQGYSYRGIESITRHAQALFGKYGIVPVPRVESRNTIDLVINGRPWTQDELTVVYRVYGPSHGLIRERRAILLQPDGTSYVETVDEKIEDWIDVGPLWGLGRDNSDKSANKSMTQAFKYALIQMLVIGDGKDDPDAEQAHEADAKPEPVDPAKQARIEASKRIRELSPAARDEVRKFCDEHEPKISRVAAQWTDEDLEAVIEYLDRRSIAEDQGAVEPESPSAGPEGGEKASDGEQGVLTPEEPAEVSVEAQIAAIIDRVKAMPFVEVHEALIHRKAAKTGNEETQRKRLAQLIIDEEVHKPEAAPQPA